MSRSSSSSLGGMSGPFSRRGPAACPRCARETEATWPWPGWRRVRRGWLGLIGLLVMASPLYLADVHGMLPAALVMVAAIGPLNSLAEVSPTCLDCGAVVEPPVRSS